MLQSSYPYYLANRPVAANTDLEVTNKFTGEVATKVALADPAAINEGIAAGLCTSRCAHALRRSLHRAPRRNV